MRIRKLVIVALACCLSALLLAGCAQTQGSDTGQTRTVTDAMVAT